MKKTCIVILVLILALCCTASAATWSNPDVTSPYIVGVIPIKQTTSIFGHTTYQQYFGSAQAGDSIAFCVRVEVPDKPRAATLTVKGANVVLDCVLTATVPMQTGVYYLKPTGGWSTDFAVISGYCTGVPTVTAYLRGDERVDSIGGYQIARSDGFMFSKAGRGVYFCPDAQGKVYASYVYGLDYRYKLTSALLAEDSEYGAVARNVLSTLGIDGASLVNGSVYMTERLLSANFGALIDTEYSKTWGTAATIPITPIAEVPSTGMAGDLITCAGVCVMIALAIKMFYRKED